MIWGGGDVVNLLIRDLSDDVLAALDAEAERRGLSRSEYVRRILTQASTRGDRSVTVDDLARFAGAFADLADPELLDRAWR